MNDYKILNIIGQGAFGNAYLAKHLKTDQEFVIKKIQLNGKNKEQIQNIYHQVQLLEEFKHVNIVSYRESIKQGQELNIVMEYCSGGDMNQLIVEQKESHGGRKLQERKVLQWAAQIALAIFYMHDKRILHRDLKTPNIFILDKKVKLGDFGISKVLDEKQDLASTSIGTPYYMSPQQYRHRPYSYKSDMWAFGCILYEMCNQKRPFEALSLNGLAVKVLQAKFSPVSEYYSKQFQELIHKMLQKKEKDRPSILQFLQAPVIKKKAAAYLKQTYTTLLKQNGDKVLIQGVIYQSKKLGISLPQKINTNNSESKKKLKPQLTVQKRKNEKQRVKKELQAKLAELKKQTNQQSIQLKKQMNQRDKISQKINPFGKKSSHGSVSSKSFKEQSTAHSQEKIVAPISSKVDQKHKQFQLKQKYDMYQMQFQDQQDDSQEQEPVRQVIVEVQQQDERPYQKQKYIKPVQKQGKQSKSQQSRFTQLAPQQNASSVSNTPIQQKINKMKEQIRHNMQKVNTIQNQISNIDFSISSSEDDDEFERNIEAERMPVIKKKELNPVHVLLTDKTNDLQQTLENILPKITIKELISLAKNKGNAVSRAELQKVVGENKLGAYHLAFELVKLNSVLEKIPQYS